MNVVLSFFVITWTAHAGNSSADNRVSFGLPVIRLRSFYPWAIGLFVLGLWWSRTFTLHEYFARTLALGWYRSDADSIAIPEMGGFLITVFATPFVLLLLWLALRRFPARVRLLAWSDDRIGPTVVWTALCALLCYFEISDLRMALQLRLPITGVVGLLWIATWLLLRAILVSREKRPNPNGSGP